MVFISAAAYVACSNEDGDSTDGPSGGRGGDSRSSDGGVAATVDAATMGGTPGGGGTSGGAGGNAGASGGHAGGAGGVAQTGACLTQTCLGRCEGSSCSGLWKCVTEVACTADIVSYCGCDGKTFEGSSTCAGKAYLAKGACDEISCDPKKVLCKSLPPTCKANEVPSVHESCWGPCVRIEQCACKLASDCPMENMYTCHGKRACGPYVN
ncbi:MAG: hypothetical protein SF187_20055 [Deltaproteobacteria bacterium]|nr:hypothetical protein [Deltaproteobacteria bacterium]